MKHLNNKYYTSSDHTTRTISFYFILQGGQDYIIGRTNNNSVDLNRNFPDLDRIMYSYEAEHIDHNNHLLDQVTQLTEPVRSTLIL